MMELEEIDGVIKNERPWSICGVEMNLLSPDVEGDSVLVLEACSD